MCGTALGSEWVLVVHPKLPSLSVTPFFGGWMPSSCFSKVVFALASWSWVFPKIQKLLPVVNV